MENENTKLNGLYEKLGKHINEDVDAETFFGFINELPSIDPETRRLFLDKIQDFGRIIKETIELFNKRYEFELKTSSDHFSDISKIFDSIINTFAKETTNQNLSLEERERCTEMLFQTMHIYLEESDKYRAERTELTKSSNKILKWILRTLATGTVILLASKSDDIKDFISENVDKVKNYKA